MSNSHGLNRHYDKIGVGEYSLTRPFVFSLYLQLFFHILKTQTQAYKRSCAKTYMQQDAFTTIRFIKMLMALGSNVTSTSLTAHFLNFQFWISLHDEQVIERIVS